MKKPAFTLAEVLITLGIIGIVSTLTLPPMITKYKKQQTVTQLKKAYSVMSNAFSSAEQQHGPISTWPEAFYTTVSQGVCANLNDNNDCALAFFNKYLANQFTHYEYKKRPERLYKNLVSFNGINNVINFDAGGKSYKWFYLDDGTCFFLVPNINYYLDYVFYDINGDKGPNIVGKDIFVFDFGWIRKFKFSFHGASWSNVPTEETRKTILDSNCSKTEGGYSGGNGCGWIIQYDGWQIKDDYPW